MTNIRNNKPNSCHNFLPNICNNQPNSSHIILLHLSSQPNTTNLPQNMACHKCGSYLTLGMANCGGQPNISSPHVRRRKLWWVMWPECGDPCLGYQPNTRLRHCGEPNFKCGNVWRATKQSLAMHHGKLCHMKCFKRIYMEYHSPGDYTLKAFFFAVVVCIFLAIRSSISLLMNNILASLVTFGKFLFAWLISHDFSANKQWVFSIMAFHTSQPFYYILINLRRQ